MYSSSNVQFQVYCQSLQTARFSKVPQLIPVANIYNVLIGLLTTNPCDKLSGRTDIGFKQKNDQTVNLISLDKLH